MALREDFEKHGIWLFRWRSYLPLVMLPVMIAGLLSLAASGHKHLGVGMQSYQVELGFEFVCLAVSVCGMVVRALTVGYAAPGTSGRNMRNQRADSLNTTGIYSVTRHPLYLGNFLIGFGPILFCRTWWASGLYMTAFWLYYERIMFTEEEFLRRKFCNAFVSWADKTPAFLPRIANWTPPSQRLSLRHMIRNENPVWFLCLSVFTLLDGLENRFVEGNLRFGGHWIGLFAVSGSVWLVLRMVRRYNKLPGVAALPSSKSGRENAGDKISVKEP